MSIDPKELPQYDGKKIVLVVDAGEGEDAAEYTGKAEVASTAGIGFKESGKRDVVLVEPAQILEISLAPEKAKKITQKKSRPVKSGNVRQHLADRHGLPLDQLNGRSEADAVEYHDGLDHSNLGHIHVPVEEESAEQSAA